MEEQGNYFVELGRKKEGLLCYQISNYVSSNNSKNLTTPFRVNFPKDIDQIILGWYNSVGNVDLGERLNLLTEEMKNYFVYSLSQETAEDYQDFYQLKDDAEINLVNFVLYNKEGDCDTHNTAFAALLRQEMNLPTNITKGDVCNDSLRCEINNNISHAWANVIREDGYLIKIDATGKKRE